jgi:uncharacterized protein YydD (DUF2326 family)
MALELPKQTLTDLNRAYSKVLEQQATLDKLENAGDDVSEARAILNTWQEKIAGYKRELFPTSR